MYNRIYFLNIPVPTNFAEVCGYNGDCKYVAFYWEPNGDELIYNTNIEVGTGEYYGFLLYINHPTVKQKIKPFNIGGSDKKHNHMLLLDKINNFLYIGFHEDILNFLKEVQPTFKSNEILNVDKNDWINFSCKVYKYLHKEQNLNSYYKNKEQEIQDLQKWIKENL